MLNALSLPRQLQSDRPRARQRISDCCAGAAQCVQHFFPLSSDSLRCIINTLVCPGAMIHFLGRWCQFSKSIRRLKTRDARFLQATIDIRLFCCVFCSLIPTGHLVGSNRTAVLVFVDILQQCVFIRFFSGYLSANVGYLMPYPPLPNK